MSKCRRDELDDLLTRVDVLQGLLVPQDDGDLDQGNKRADANVGAECAKVCLLREGILGRLEDIVDARHLLGRQVENRYAVVVQPLVAQNSAQQVLGTVHIRWIDLHAQVQAVDQAGRRKDCVDPAGPVAAHLVTHELQELEHAVSVGQTLHVGLRHFFEIGKFGIDSPSCRRRVAAGKEVLVLVVLQVAVPRGGHSAGIHSLPRARRERNGIGRLGLQSFN